MTLGGRPERHTEVRTSGFSGSVYNYIDMFLDSAGDPNTAAAVDQKENQGKHREASQVNPSPAPGLHQHCPCLTPPASACLLPGAGAALGQAGLGSRPR